MKSFKTLKWLFIVLGYLTTSMAIYSALTGDYGYTIFYAILGLFNIHQAVDCERLDKKWKIINAEHEKWKEEMEKGLEKELNQIKENTGGKQND